jgi:hypothetical protein
MLGRSFVTMLVGATLPLATPRVIDLPAQSLPVFGGSGGSSFTRSCGADRVLTGLRYREGSWMDAIGLLCRPVASNGSLLSETSIGTLAGGSGGTVKVRSCPAGHVVTGIRIYYAAFVDGLDMHCRPWNAATRTWDSSEPARRIIVANYESTSAIASCESSAQPVVSMRGRAGMFVDAIGFTCNEP